MQNLAVRAKQAGLQMVEVGGRVEARLGSKVLAFHSSVDRAIEKALERLEEDRLRKLDRLPSDREPVLVIPPKKTPARVLVEALPVAEYTQADKERAGKVISGSIIKSKYKDRYKKKGYCCGDDMAEELAAYIKVVKDGKLCVDMARLKEVAVTNGVWRDSYERLNIGQIRMNVGNRLRAKRAAGDAIDIGGAIFQLKFD